MGNNKIVSGVFLQMSSLKEAFTERSTRWRISVLILLVGALALVISFIGMAVNSNSGLGLQVIGITIFYALIILASSMFRRRKVTAGQMTEKFDVLLVLGIISLILICTLPFGFVLAPLQWIELSLALFGGGLTLGIILLLMYDAYPILRERGSPGIITTVGFLLILAMIYMTAISFWIVPFHPIELNVGPLLSPPSPAFPLGTTSLGQDLLSRTITGGAIMLQVAALSAFVCFLIGVPAGLAASYRGGAVDRVVSLVMDSIFAFPGLVLAIAIAAMLGPGVVNMALAIAVVYVPSYFRVVRSQVLTIKELPYVEAAILMGAKDRDIIFRYILPNVLPSAIVIVSINFADAVLTAAALTFVGLGLSIDVPDWGWDLQFGFQQLIVGAWWVITFPGFMIVLLALGFTLAGEGLNEILTPKLKE